MTTLEAYRAVRDYYVPQRWYYLLGAACALAAGGANAGFVPCVRYLADEIKVLRLNGVWQWLAIMGGLVVVRSFANLGMNYFMTLVGERSMLKMRSAAYDRLLNLNLAFFVRSHSGDIGTRIINDADRISDGMRAALITFIPQALTITAVVGYLFYLSWQMGLVVLVVAPLFCLHTSMLVRPTAHVFQRQQSVLSRLQSHVNDSVRGVQEIKAFRAEGTFGRHMRDLLQDRYRAMMASAVLMGLREPVVGVINFLGVALVLYAGVWLVKAEMLTGASAIAFLTGVVLLYQPVVQFNNAVAAIIQARVSAERFLEVTQDDGAEDMTAGEVPPALYGDLRFEDVTFRYDGEAGQVIDHVDLEIHAGERVALVGGSGQGKSTLANLILRFHDPLEGAIYLDDRDLRTVNLAWLREHVGLVTQNNVMMPVSLRDNIAMGRAGASPPEIEAAARLADIHEFIVGLPAGYDTVVGEGGANLSYGQRQRVALARIFLKDPQIIIFDEATSSLDAATNRFVLEKIDELPSDKTIIIISHNFTNTRHVDRIFVVDKGAIVEQGDHRTLMELGGIYHELFMLQDLAQ